MNALVTRPKATNHSQLLPYRLYVIDRSIDPGDEHEIVLAGPFDDPDEAQEVKRELRASGNRGAVVFSVGGGAA